MQKFKLIIVGNYQDAISDLRDGFIEFTQSSMTGIASDGPFCIVHVDKIETAKGLRIRSYEFHSSTYGYMYLDRAEQIAKTLVR